MDKIITQILDLLSDDNKSLSSALTKLKIIAASINNNTLLDWLNKELKGYIKPEDIPSYRIFPCCLKGSYINGYTQIKAQNLPTINFPDELKNYVNTKDFAEPISVIEEIKNENETKKYILNGDIIQYINLFYKEQNPYFDLYDCYLVVGDNVHTQIIERVRQYALDLVLSLVQELGYEIDLSRIIQEKEKANQIINNYMNTNNISNSGDGNVINTGNENTIHNQVHIEKQFRPIKTNHERKGY